MTHEQKKEQETDRLSRQTNPMDMLQGLYLNSIEIKEVDPRKLMPKEAPGFHLQKFLAETLPKLLIMWLNNLKQQTTHGSKTQK